jgi:hypothetical protein
MTPLGWCRQLCEAASRVRGPRKVAEGYRQTGCAAARTVLTDNPQLLGLAGDDGKYETRVMPAVGQTQQGKG